MNQRRPEERRRELDQIDQAHAQNETVRDSFLAVAHTALFAASIAFVGDITPLKTASWKWALIISWASSAGGLLALSISYPIVGGFIARRRRLIDDPNEPVCRVCAVVNNAALYSFPISVIALFLFVSINVVRTNEPTKQTDRTVSTGTWRGPERGDASTAPSGAATIAPVTAVPLTPEQARKAQQHAAQ